MISPLWIQTDHLPLPLSNLQAKAALLALILHPPSPLPPPPPPPLCVGLPVWLMDGIMRPLVRDSLPF